MGQKKAINLFDFSKFINENWNDFFYKLIAEAKADADDAAYSMGGQEVQKLPLLPGSHTNDQKYLYQFHPNVWKQALKKRYNDDLIDIGQHWDNYGKLPPEEANKADEVVFQIPHARAKPGKPYYRVYTGLDNEAKMYVGHHDLGYKLSNPAKALPNEHLDNPKFGPGPSLSELNPKDAASVEQYLKHGHGFYDFDLSNAVTITDEYIDSLPDADIVEALDPFWKKKYDELPEDANGHKIVSKEVREKINEKRASMKKNPLNTTSGYNVMQSQVANDLMSNWIKATSLGLLGPMPDKIKDPATGKEVPVVKIPFEKAKEDFGISTSVGFDPTETRLKEKKDMTPEEKKAFKLNKYAPGKKFDLDVYAFPRQVKYYEEDYQGNFIPGSQKIETIYVPFLPDTKVLPSFPLTQQQKAILAHRRRPDLIPKGTPEEMLNSYKAALENPAIRKEVERASSLTGAMQKGIDGIFGNWDLWTPEQIKHMQDNARTLPEVAKAMHTKSKDDPYAIKSGYYALGHESNKNDIGTPYLGIPKEKMKDFLAKYQPLMAGEAYTAVERWIKNQEAGKAGEVQLPKEVVGTLDNLAPELITVITYFLMTWLNDKDLGVYDPDPKYGLTFAKNSTIQKAGPEELGGSAAKQLRRHKAYNILNNIGQATLDGFPGRRARLKFNLAAAELDKKIGDEDGSSAGSMVSDKGDIEGFLKNVRYKHSFNRSLTTPTLGKGVARSGWKLDVTNSNEELNAKLGSVRNRIRRVLGDEIGDIVDNAEKKLKVGINMAQELYKKYDEEFKKQYPDDEKRHNLVTNMVTKDLMKHLKSGHQDLYGDMDSEEIEELLTKIKNNLQSAGMNYSAPLEQADHGYKLKLDSAMKRFWTNLLKNGSAIQPLYDKQTQQFKETGLPISITMFKEPNTNVLHPPSAKFVVDAMKALYPQDMPDEINKSLDTYALHVYKSILSRYGVKKDDKELADELMKLGVRPEVYTTPQAKPVIPQPPVMAAKSIDDVLTKLTQFKTPQEYVQLVGDVLSRTDEFAKNPALAQKLRDIMPLIRKNRESISHEMTPDEFLASSQLRTLLQKVSKNAN